MKHYYSIYKKMKNQNLSVSQVYDIVAFRVIVQSIKECYEVLGQSMPCGSPSRDGSRTTSPFPKENMYQSLHTTVIGPSARGMEVQIRTWEMDHDRRGGHRRPLEIQGGQRRRTRPRSSLPGSGSFWNGSRTSRTPGISGNGPNGPLSQRGLCVHPSRGSEGVPRGATPVDFAYSIHSEVGDKCIGARVNGKMVPLRYQLENGDIVEIITSTKQHPSKDWLDFVKTPRAKTKIRQWIKQQEREESHQPWQGDP